MRLFVAFDLSETVRSRIALLLRGLEQSELSRRAGIRWLGAESLHLTLKFIGEQPEEKLQAVVEALSAVPAPAPMDLKFRGLGCFPNDRRPRVFWLGVEAPPELGGLASGIEQALEPLGIAREHRSFSAHLTIGRLKDAGHFNKLRSQVGNLLESRRDEDFGWCRAEEFFLYRSQLTPDGSQYTKIKAFPLSAMS